MKKILIIGAGVEQVGAIKTAREMGHEVVVTDMNTNAPGIKFSNRFHKISTTDIQGNIKIGNEENIDGVMTVCSETAVPSVAHVAYNLSLPGFSIDTALKATNKSLMRRALTELNVRMPEYTIANSLNEVNHFTNFLPGPWVLKPVDSSGQRGSSVISDKKNLKNAFVNAIKHSPSKEILIDQFIKGPEVHVAMQVINNDVHFLAISDRITLNRKNFGIAVRHIGPSILTTELEKDIKNICRDSIKAINIENGIATCELIIKNNKAFLMEVAIRVPGGYLREVAMYLSGVDVYKTTIWNCLGDAKKFNDLVTEEKHPAISVKFISSLNIDPKIKKITNVSKFKGLETDNIKLINLHFSGKFDVPELKSSVGRFGAIIGVGETRKEAVSETESIFNMLEFNGLHLREYNNYNESNVDFTTYLKK